MTSRGLTKFNIGKNGITPGVIASLNAAFKTHKLIRISLLKNYCRDREDKEKIAEELNQKLEGYFRHNIIGFTIIMRKVGKKKNKSFGTEDL
ncbi:hypothetical protein AUJ84_04490 [Candidatus Pacearchaeota archaeon CG1_02_32_132]|nr:MAG: hypothetical protein AUJ84_04490 [Candidatus Pacearchaeota archaeon CG1_02_32_132]